MKKDYRKNQKVIMTLILEDKGQDFIEIDVLENGVILGNSMMFENGRISIIGIGTLNGMDYWRFKDIMKMKTFATFYIYIKDTDEPDPEPWKAKTLNYKIIDVKKAIKPNRFL